MHKQANAFLVLAAKGIVCAETIIATNVRQLMLLIPQSENDMQRTITYDKHRYVVNYAREGNCGYVKITLFITKVLNKDTGIPVQYPKRTRIAPDGQSTTEYFTQEESMIRHIRHMMTAAALSYVMGAAERCFAQYRED